MDQLVGEGVPLDVHHFVVGELVVDGVGNGIEQVGLAQAGLPVDEQGVIRLDGGGIAEIHGVRHGFAGGVGKFVFASYNKSVESVLVFPDPHIRFRDGAGNIRKGCLFAFGKSWLCLRHRGRRFLCGSSRLHCIGNAEDLYLYRETQNLRKSFLQGLQILAHQNAAVKFKGDDQKRRVVFKPTGLDVFNPAGVGGLRQLVCANLFLKVFFHQG